MATDATTADIIRRSTVQETLQLTKEEKQLLGKVKNMLASQTYDFPEEDIIRIIKQHSQATAEAIVDYVYDCPKPEQFKPQAPKKQSPAPQQQQRNGPRGPRNGPKQHGPRSGQQQQSQQQQQDASSSGDTNAAAAPAQQSNGHANGEPKNHGGKNFNNRGGKRNQQVDGEGQQPEQQRPNDRRKNQRRGDSDGQHRQGQQQQQQTQQAPKAPPKETWASHLKKATAPAPAPEPTPVVPPVQAPVTTPAPEQEVQAVIVEATAPDTNGAAPKEGKPKKPRNKREKQPRNPHPIVEEAAIAIASVSLENPSTHATESVTIVEVEPVVEEPRHHVPERTEKVVMPAAFGHVSATASHHGHRKFISNHNVKLTPAPQPQTTNGVMSSPVVVQESVSPSPSPPAIQTLPTNTNTQNSIHQHNTSANGSVTNTNSSNISTNPNHPQMPMGPPMMPPYYYHPEFFAEMPHWPPMWMPPFYMQHGNPSHNNAPRHDGKPNSSPSSVASTNNNGMQNPTNHGQYPFGGVPFSFGYPPNAGNQPNYPPANNSRTGYARNAPPQYNYEEDYSNQRQQYDYQPYSHGSHHGQHHHHHGMSKDSNMNSDGSKLGHGYGDEPNYQTFGHGQYP